MNIAYKVVRCVDDKLVSARTDNYDDGFRQRVEYKVGEFVKAPRNTRLFLFEKEVDATWFCCDTYENIYKVEYIDGVKGYPCSFVEHILDFWEYFNEHGEFHPRYIMTNTPSILAKEVKLLELTY